MGRIDHAHIERKRRIIAAIEGTAAMPKTAKTSRRGNAVLHAQALALSLHPWNNTVSDWQALESVVTQLGAAAPKAAKAALDSRKRSMRKLPNPFGG